MFKVFRRLPDGSITTTGFFDARGFALGLGLCLIVGAAGDLLELTVANKESQLFFVFFAPAVFVAGMLARKSIALAILSGALAETLALLNPQAIPLHSFADGTRVLEYMLLNLANILIFGVLPAASGVLYCTRRYRTLAVSSLFGVQLLVAIAAGIGRTRLVSPVEAIALLVVPVTLWLLLHVGHVRVRRMAVPGILALAGASFIFIVSSAVLHPPH
ncbi:hypothetical protein [Ferrimicrobium sp.]|uniref:hypothetical protein n=1 Tax=Ferrimicrobium sp. TaxID=2926050 RepID=UPI00261BC1FD|nr:hypothetical protein [Ferrimicrobium sp.]